MVLYLEVLIIFRIDFLKHLYDLKLTPKMPVSLNPNVLCALPKHSPPMTTDEVIRSLKLLERRFDTMAKVLDQKSATKLLTRLLLGLSTDSRELYTSIGMTYPGDAIPTEKKKLCRNIASKVVESDNILFISSDMVGELLDTEDDLEDIDPHNWHFLHLLQVKSGWTLTAIGREDSLWLGDDYTCCIFNGFKNGDIEKMDKLLYKDHDFTLTDEVPFRLNEINPLDTTTWRDLRSTPFPSSPDDSDDDSWTDDYPIVVAEVQNLDHVYAKLDETTRYKNNLVKKLYDLHEQHETLKKQVRDSLGNSLHEWDN